MFVYTVRASGLKFFAVVALTLVVLVGLVLGGGTVLASAAPGEINFSGMKTREDRIAFLAAFGIEVEEGEECVSFVMPENFDRVLLGYNELQRRQGLDISKYAKKKITRYTYTVSNYEGYDGEVKANLLIYRNRIIACDISSADPGGFVEPIVKQ
jgi:hypothetical protein